MYLSSNDQYDLSVCSNDGVGGWANPGDGDFDMYDSSGNLLWYIDGSSNCFNDASTLGTQWDAWSPPSTGYYYLRVLEYSQEPMTYELARKWIRGPSGRSSWCSSRGEDATPPHRLHQFNADGLYTGVSVEQVPEAQASAWGYRDGAVDRDSHMFFGWETGVAQHDAEGSNGTQIIAGPAPGEVGVWRALAFDPTGDNGNGSLWVTNLNTPLIEVDLGGTLLRSFENTGWSVYGLAYDDADGNLWGHDTEGRVIKIDTTTGQIIPGVGWETAFADMQTQGGLSGAHDGTGELAAVSQATPDQLGVYDLSGTLIGGPWDLDGQTGTDGHLGVAVIAGAGSGELLGDLNCDEVVDVADIEPFMLALVDPAEYVAAYPECDISRADMNGDGSVDGRDIQRFAEALLGL